MASALPLIFDTSLEEFDQAVLAASHETPILVDFWAEWCPPCVVLAPVLEKVVASYGGRVRLAKVEVDEGENMKLAGRYGLRGFPTVLLFVNGEEKARFASARPEGWLRDFLEKHAGL
ncbi:MAG: thioredoxin fold domain-containing protein [Burkholderiales bacterium]|nr:thioredoxin fold domain-containing protein [Burkholderiales bacterium]